MKNIEIFFSHNGGVKVPHVAPEPQVVDPLFRMAKNPTKLIDKGLQLIRMENTISCKRKKKEKKKPKLWKMSHVMGKVLLNFKLKFI